MFSIAHQMIDRATLRTVPAQGFDADTVHVTFRLLHVDMLGTDAGYREFFAQVSRAGQWLGRPREQLLPKVRIQLLPMGGWYVARDAEIFRQVEPHSWDMIGLTVHFRPTTLGWIDGENIPSDHEIQPEYWAAAEALPLLGDCQSDMPLSSETGLLVGVDPGQHVLLRNVTVPPVPLEVSILRGEERMLTRQIVPVGEQGYVRTNLQVPLGQDRLGPEFEIDVRRIEPGMRRSHLLAEVDNVWLVHSPDGFLDIENRNASPVYARVMLGSSLLCSGTVEPYRTIRVSGIVFERPEENGMELEVFGVDEVVPRVDGGRPAITQPVARGISQREADDLANSARNLRRVQPPSTVVQLTGPHLGPDSGLRVQTGTPAVPAERARTVRNIDNLFPEAIARFNRPMVVRIVNWGSTQPEPTEVVRQIMYRLNNTDYSTEALNQYLTSIGVPQSLLLVDPDEAGGLLVSEALRRLVGAALAEGSVPVRLYGTAQVRRFLAVLDEMPEEGFPAETRITLLREIHALRPFAMNRLLEQHGCRFVLEQITVDAAQAVPAQPAGPTTVNPGSVRRRLDFDDA